MTRRNLKLAIKREKKAKKNTKIQTESQKDREKKKQDNSTIGIWIDENENDV